MQQHPPVSQQASPAEPLLCGAAPSAERAAKPLLAAPEFWLLWLPLLVGMGTGFLMLANMGQMADSLGAPAGAPPVLVSLFSVANCSGRLLCGAGSELALRRWGVPRAACLTLVSAMTACIALGTAFAPASALYLSAALEGLAFGAFFCLMPVLAAELFGVARLGRSLAALHLAPTLGGLLMAGGLAGRLYDAAAQRQGRAGGTCLGPACFRLTFLLAAAANVLGCLTAPALWLRTSKSLGLVQSGDGYQAV